MCALPIVAIVILFGACSALVSEDDPRNSSSFSEPGECDGVSEICEWRTLSQCGMDCIVKPTCVAVQQEHCAAIRDGDACDSDASCFWVSGYCRPSGGGSCPYEETATACNKRTGECMWTNGCTGEGAYCFEQDTAAVCTAIPGCSWLGQ